MQQADLGNASRAEGDGFTLFAAVLNEDVADDKLGVDASARSVVPIAFAFLYGGAEPCVLSRTDFALSIDRRYLLEPSLPGRAASLLRDSSGSTAAIWTGYALVGVLAAPSIDAAEESEDRAVVANGARIFAQATVAPGAAETGYLFFESPEPVDEIRTLELEMRTGCPITSTSSVVTLSLTNPYAE